MSSVLSRSPDWTDLLKIKKPASQSQKKKQKEYVTNQQRNEMVDFILENPEMVTHSSTKENEATLWNDLAKKLNALSPERSVTSWQIFWRKWCTTLETKKESSRTMVDWKLIRFLNTIGVNNKDVQASQSAKPTTSLEEICNSIKEVEEEKTKIKKEIDNMEYFVATYKTQIAGFQEAIEQKRQECKQLSIKKSNLNRNKRKFEGKENSGEK